MPGVFVSPKGSTDILRVSGGQVELSSGFELVQGEETTVALPTGFQLDDFRWVKFANGVDADSFNEDQRVPVGSIRAVPTVGTLYVVNIEDNTRVRLSAVDITDGTLTSVGVSEDFSYSIHGLSAFYYQSTAYIVITSASQDGWQLFLLNLITAGLTAQGPFHAQNNLASFGTTVVGSTVYAFKSPGGLHTLDPSDGSLTDVDPAVSAPSGGQHALALGSVNNVLYAAIEPNSVVTFYSVSMTTGEFTQLNPSGVQIGGLGYLGIGLTGHLGELYVADAVGSGMQLQLATFDTTAYTVSLIGDNQPLDARSGVGLFSAEGGPPYTEVSDYFYLQRTSQTQLDFYALRAGRVHSVVGVL